MLTPSSRRDTRPDAKKSTSCMSGVFHLISRRHHNRCRKRLSPAGKKDKAAGSPANTATESERTLISPEKGTDSEDSNRPTLDPEIRRPCLSASLDNSPRCPPALVARLMGMDEVPVSSTDSAAEKRRKLLGALEKCDEDLRALKRIIEAVQLAEIRTRSVAAAGVETVDTMVVSRRKQWISRAGREDLDGRDWKMEAVKCSDNNGGQPSPVSVLDALSSPVRRSNRSDHGKHHKKARGTDENRRSVFHLIAIEGLPRAVEHREEEAPEDSESAWKGADVGRRQRWWWWWRRSRGMAESVVEVWEDGVWEERWEFGRVGVVLEGDIFGDLVEEVVMEMLGGLYKPSIPIGTCRKRLCF